MPHAPVSGFDRRILLGWISEFVNRPLPGKWPQIPLDDETLSDFDGYLALMRDTGYTDLAVWGLFVDRNWPLDVASCIDDDRRARIARLMASAEAHGVRLQCGLGLYSWGFEQIIRDHPHLSRGNPRAMCPNVLEAQEIMHRVLDFVLGFGFDGLDLQSADQGRCPCDECAPLSDIAYHARINADVAAYIHATRPDVRLVLDNWGLPFADESVTQPLAALSPHLDAIIDHDNSTQSRDASHRRRLIAALSCPYGTLAGHSVWPPIRWERDRWFLPTTVTNVDYLRQLHADGGRAISQFVTTQANPSGEITLRFMGKLFGDVHADPIGLLSEAAAETYGADETTASAIAVLIADVERAYFENSTRDNRFQVGLFFVDEGFLGKNEPGEPTYLIAMTDAGRAAYAVAVRAALASFEPLVPSLQNGAKAAQTVRCFQNVLQELERLAA